MGEIIIRIVTDQLEKQISRIVEDAIDSKLEHYLEYLKNSDTPLTTDQTAEYLSVSKQTIHRWVKVGIIKSRLIGRRRYFLKSEIKDIIHSQRY